MRKVAIMAASCAAIFGVVSVAQAIEADQGLEVSVSGAKKGTKKKPSAVKLTVTTLTAGKGATPDGTFGTTNAVIHFDKALVFNNKQFPTCTEAQVNNDATKCPKGSKVSVDGSSSKAKAQGGTGATAIKANPAITAYNASGGKLILKLTSPTGEFNATGTIVATLKKDTGSYGSKLVVPIPEKYYNQFGIKITLQRFGALISAKTKVKGKTVSYVASTGCKKPLKFAGDFTFTDGATLKASTTAACK
ncbi:hypothetical protein DSM112329_03522 [Paraconexibacter sp. AEG42_29]|uniref:Uncharacterized protein n=1 Tax=Paraconexibacter sp. AEG42_29 TaxID=2997339 RepID=A0AAU7AZA6_9ACTN